MCALLFLLHVVVTTQKIVGDMIQDHTLTVIYKCLWCKYGKIAVWCYRTWKFLNSAKQSYWNLCTKTLSIWVPFFNNIF